MRVEHLAVRVCEHGRTGAVQHRGPSRAETRCPGRLDADQSNVHVVEEAGEQPDRVRSPSDARDDCVREPVVSLEHLRPRLAPDNGLQLSYYARIRRRPHTGADQVVGRLDVRDPVADRLARCLLERLRAELDGAHLGTEKPHALDIRMLATHVLGTHVDDALEPEARAHRCGRDTVLSRSRLGDDAPLAEARRKQDLPQRVVDLVRAGVVQVLALEHDAAAPRCETLGLVQRRRAPDVVLAERVELVAKGRVGSCVRPSPVELVERRDQRLGDVAAAIGAVRLDRHRAASTYARIRP